MGLLRIFRGFTATGSPKVGAPEWNADLQYSGELPVSNGGTGAATAEGARANLGVPFETVLDIAPTLGLVVVDASWTPGRYRSVQILIDGVRPQVGSASNDLYMRVKQAGVLKSGGTDYYRHDASWAAGSGSVADGAESIMRISAAGGIVAASEPAHASLNLFLGGTGIRGGLTGTSRWINNSSARCVATIGHQVIVSDAPIDGFVLGWVGGTGTDTYAADGRVQVIGLLA